MTEQMYAPKGAAVPVAIQPVVVQPQRAKPPTDAQARKALKRAASKEAAESLPDSPAMRLAQIVNLHIAGYSLAQIGEAVGSTAEEIDRMLAQDAQRYVRSQPALRVYVRNYISERYTALLEAVWDEATDKTHREKLENQDRALRILKEMSRLHGAEAPVQTEVKVDAAPEAVEKLVQALASQQGLGYDASIFDSVEQIVDVEVLHDEAVQALEVSGNRVGDSDGDDAL